MATTESVQDEQALREEIFESRWEAAPAVLVVIATQVTVALLSRAQGWQLWIFPWWAWLIPTVPEGLLFLTLTLEAPRRQLQQLGVRRMFGLAMIGIIVVADGLLILALLISLIQSNETGGHLLIMGLTVWTSNVATFGLAFWSVDRGGPVRRLEPDPPPPDFQFPQMENPQIAPRGWRPHLIDYAYVSFTNSIAFSPTDAMPLTHWAKFLMLVESALSAATLLLVVARAVNIFR